MKQIERYFFPAIFTYERGQEIAVSCPDLDVATSGENETDALLSARELLGCVLNGLEEDGEEIPVPTPLADIKLGKNERAVLVDVYMPAIQDGASQPKCESHGDVACMAQRGSIGTQRKLFSSAAGRFEIIPPCRTSRENVIHIRPALCVSRRGPVLSEPINKS